MCYRTTQQIEGSLVAPLFDEAHRFRLDLVEVASAKEPIVMQAGDLSVAISRISTETLAFAVRWCGDPAVRAQVAIEVLRLDGHRADRSWEDTDDYGQTTLMWSNDCDLEPGTSLEVCVALSASSAGHTILH